MKYFVQFLTAGSIALTCVPLWFAQEAKAAAATTAALSQGEIKKIDVDAGKLTIKHGELKNLAMAPMTMVFVVSDKTALAQVKPGDSITFVATNAGGQLAASNITVVK